MAEIQIKKPLLLAELKQFSQLDKVIIESLEQTLYRLIVEAEGISYYVLETPDKSLTRRSILEIQELLIPFNVKAMYLLHTSPYDEMIGLEVNQSSNELLVPLGNQHINLADMTIH